MYYRYFGLTEAPFSIAVDPRYLFMSARHRDALAHLLYGVGEGGGFVLLTGEVGTGKTTIIRSLLEQLPESTDIAMVFNPALEADELLATVCDELGIDYGERTSRKHLTDCLHRFLLDNYARGRHTVLLIDEAQHLKFEVLEQIRLLTNLETNTKKLLQIILVGQPELRSLLNRPELRQLAQRITARYQLKPLNRQETEDYIRHRLHIAGLPAGQVMFPRRVIRAIHRTSGGVPRLINVLCDRMLLGAYGQNKTRVDGAMFRQAAREVIGEEAWRSGRRWQKPALAAAGLVLVAAAVLLWQWPLQPQPETASTADSNASPAAPATDTAVSQTAAETTTTGPFWFNREAAALGELLAVIGETDAAADPHCDPEATGPLRCERVSVGSWQALRAYNRPAVLTLITASRQQRHVVVTGLDEAHARVSIGGETVRTPLADLGRQWTGEALFYWHADPHYRGPVSLGDSGAVVEWVAGRFATLDQQDTPLAQQRFNRALQQRVELFQRAHGLRSDGVVGLRTLLKLNESLDAPVTLNTSGSGADKPAAGGER